MQPKTIGPLYLLVICCACVPAAHEWDPKVPKSVAEVASIKTLGAQTAPARPDATAFAFGDPQLQQLLAHGLRNNPHYAETLARVRKADALAGQERASMRPQINADGSLNEAQESRNIGFPAQFSNFIPKGLHSNSRVTLGATLDADLFGRNKAALAALVSEAAAASYDQHQAQLILYSLIAQAYVDFGRANDDEAAARAVAALRQHELVLATLRRKVGLDDASVVAKAISDVQSARETVAVAQSEIAIARYRIAALVGEGPDFGATLTVPTLALPRDLNERVGMDVIANRPDVAAAKMRVEAQASRVKAARRDFYPNISLAALAGFQSFDLSQLLLGSSAIPSVGAAIHLPLFESGRLKDAYRAQQADYDAAVATYNNTLIGALQDVSTSISHLHEAQSQYTTTLSNMQQAKRIDDIANDRLRAKIISQYAVLPTHHALLDAQAHAEDARSSLILARIDVLRALGGNLTQATGGDKQ